MKKLLSFICLVLVCCVAFAGVAKEVDIVFMHDVHSFLGKLAKAKTLIDEQLKKNTATFVFDAGDFSMGTLYQTIYETHASELRMLGKIGVDVSTLGNHEFDYGATGLKNMLEVAFNSGERLPQMVLCNIDFSKENEYTKILFPTLKKYFKDYEIIQKGDVKIAVVGVFGENALFCSPTCKITFLDAVEAVKNTVEKIKATESVDMIVCVSHSGTNSNPSLSEDEILAKNVPELDLIVSGHTHTRLEEPKKVGSTYIVSAGAYGSDLGTLSLKKENEGRWKLASYKLLPLDESTTEDAEINSLLKNYSSIIDTEYLANFEYTKDQYLTKSNYDLAAKDEVGYLIVKAFKESVNALEIEGDGNPAEIVVLPDGLLRGTYKKGPITVDDVFTSFSLGIGSDGKTGYPLVAFYITGAELLATAEIDCSISPYMSDAHLYMQSLVYEFNPYRIILDHVTDVFILNEQGEKEEIQSDKLYKIVADIYTVDMLAGLLEKTMGMISIVPKDKYGNPIVDSKDGIIYMKGKDGKKAELKAWYAIAHYLENLQDVGDWTQSRSNAVIERASLNPLNIFRNPSKLAIIVYIVILVLVVLLVLLVRFIVKKIKKRKQR